MNLSRRHNKLLSLLIDNNREMEIAIINEKLNISRKTLKTDVKQINEEIAIFLSELILEKDKLFFITNHPSTYWYDLLSLYRNLSTEQLIKIKLLLNENYITSYDLAEICYSSKSKVEKVIATLNWKYVNISAVRNRGYKLEGNKIQIYQEIWLELSSFIDPLNYIVTTKAILNKIIKIDQSEYLKAINEHQKFIASQKISHDEQINFNFMIILITKHFPHLKMSAPEMSKFFSSSHKESEKQQIEKITKKYLQKNNINDINTQTFKLLIIHLANLQSSNYHLENKTSIPKLEQIKERFNYAYVLSQGLVQELSSLMHFELSDNELLYLTIYLQTIINKNVTMIKPRIIIVSEYSKSISNYLAFKLQNNLHDDYQIEIMNLQDFRGFNVEDEIIISTLKNLENITYLQISPFPSNEEIYQVIQTIKNREVIQQFDDLFKYQIKRHVKKEDIIQQISSDMRAYQIGSDLYINSVKKRFEQQLAVINGIIILHGDPNLAYKNQILIYNLEEALSYCDESVHTLIILVLNPTSIEYFSSISKSLYRFIYNKDFAKAINSDINIQKINWYLKNNYFNS